MTPEQIKQVGAHLSTMQKALADADAAKPGSEAFIDHLNELDATLHDLWQVVEPPPVDVDFLADFRKLVQMHPEGAAQVCLVWRQVVRRYRKQLGQAPLRRRYHITVSAGGDDWTLAQRQLLELVEEVKKQGERCQTVSGGPAAGGYVEVEHDPTMTHERYIAELDAQK